MTWTARTAAVTEVASGSADITVTKPTGLSDNDVVVVQIACNGGGATLSASPPGFTVQAIGSESNPRFFLAYKYVTNAAGEGAWTFTQSSGTVAKAAVAQAWAGADPTTQLDTAISTASAATGSGACTVPSVETTTNGTLLIYGFAVNSSSSALTAPEGMVQVGESTAQKKTEMDYEFINRADETGPRSGAAASSVLAWAAYMVALRPAQPVMRMYLAEDDTGLYNPASFKGAWDKTSGAVVRRLATRRTGIGTRTTNTENVATNNYDVLIAQFVSDPIHEATTIAGTVSGVLLATESDVAANMVTHLHIWVSQGDSSTVRGTLLTDFVDSAEWVQSASATSFSAITIAEQALSSVAASVGDRIVVEVGFQAQNTSTTSYTGAINTGGSINTSSRDADGTESAVSGANTPHAWLDFTGEILFTPTYLYLTKEAAPATPAANRGTWDVDDKEDWHLARYRSGALGSNTYSETLATAHTALIYRYVSAELAAQTIAAGQVDVVAKIVENTTAVDAFQQLHLYVMASDGSVRGTLLTNEVLATEYSTLAIRRQTETLTSVAVTSGDRLVLEIGASVTNTDTTARVVTAFTGGAAADHGGTDSSATAAGGSGWIRFANKILFADEITTVDYVYETPALDLTVATPSPTYTVAHGYETPALNLTLGTPAPTWSRDSEAFTTPELTITIGTPAPTYTVAAIHQYTTPALGIVLATPAPQYVYMPPPPQGELITEGFVIADRVEGTIVVANRIEGELVYAPRIDGIAKVKVR